MNRAPASADGQRAADVVVGLLAERDALIERQQRALAAGPAALRDEAADMVRSGVAPGGHVSECAHALRMGAAGVEAAQERALKEEK